MTTPLLEVKNITKTFGGVVAVSECSMSINEGSVVGLIGPNGAGKSSLIDLVSGFERPDSGSVRFAGKEIVGRRPDVISRMGLIRTFQTPREWRDLSVVDNVRVGRSALQARINMAYSHLRGSPAPRGKGGERGALRSHDALPTGWRSQLEGVGSQRGPETTARVRAHRRSQTTT